LAVAHTDAGCAIRAWSARLPEFAPRTVFIGPEGGFEDGEIAALRGFGAETVSLGPCVLRVEMAAVAAAVLLRGEQPVVQP
ncbi:MAG: 16S rRNA (uracil(1498)-N(3))-methyltransferase, partial [Planctomycetota bacterium]